MPCLYLNVKALTSCLVFLGEVWLFNYVGFLRESADPEPGSELDPQKPLYPALQLFPDPDLVLIREED
jgi:hypothetical protein